MSTNIPASLRVAARSPVPARQAQSSSGFSLSRSPSKTSDFGGMTNRVFGGCFKHHSWGAISEIATFRELSARDQVVHPDHDLRVADKPPGDRVLAAGLAGADACSLTISKPALRIPCITATRKTQRFPFLGCTSTLQSLRCRWIRGPEAQGSVPECWR